MKKIHIASIPVEKSHHNTVSRRALLRRPDTRSHLISMNEAYLEPGEAVESHKHNDAEEVFYILEGNGNMKVNEATVSVAAGDVLFIQLGETHILSNTGPSTLKFLTILVKCRET